MNDGCVNEWMCGMFVACLVMDECMDGCVNEWMCGCSWNVRGMHYDVNVLMDVMGF